MRFRAYVASAVVLGFVTLTLTLTAARNAVAETMKVLLVQSAPTEPFFARGEFAPGDLAVVFTVPAGKRAIVEFVSAEALVAPEDCGMFLGAWTGTFFEDPGHFVAGVADGSRCRITQPIKMYLNPGQNVRAQFKTTSEFDVTMTGYLVPVP